MTLGDELRRKYGANMPVGFSVSALADEFKGVFGKKKITDLINAGRLPVYYSGHARIIPASSALHVLDSFSTATPAMPKQLLPAHEARKGKPSATSQPEVTP
jgi:hypothetical protein